ncbi:MAG: SRPBCC family protein [Bacteroidia bacterium]|nr:SRPBCC family protein [Bacteroidia bacterium]
MPTIHLQTLIHAPVQTVFDLSRSIDLHVDSMAHTRERAIAGRTSGLISLGESVTWEGRYLGVKQWLKVHITAMDPPHSFTDEQQKGAFKSFKHVHTFQAVPEGTLMIDAFAYESPFGFIGRIFNRLVLDRYLRHMLGIRNVTIKRVAEGNAE